MPKVRRELVPEGLLAHLALRIHERQISFDQLILLARWLDTDPIVPDGMWFKRFAGFTVCGEGELVKTLLTAGQIPIGTELY